MSGRRSGFGRIWSATAWVKRRRDIGQAIGRRQRGSIGRVLGRRQRGSIGRSLGRERRLWRINYSRMKKSTMVDGNNYVSLFMVDALGGARARIMVNELVASVGLHQIYTETYL